MEYKPSDFKGINKETEDYLLKKSISNKINDDLKLFDRIEKSKCKKEFRNQVALWLTVIFTIINTLILIWQIIQSELLT